MEGGDSSGNSTAMIKGGSSSPPWLKTPQERSDEEVGKIELYLSALVRTRGKRPPEAEIHAPIGQHYVNAIMKLNHIGKYTFISAQKKRKTASLTDKRFY